MTPKEVQDFCVAFGKSIGPRGKAWIAISDDGNKPLTFSVYDNWPRNDNVITGHADTFEEATSQMRNLWDKNQDKLEAERVNSLALEIISTTDRKGSCSEADLRMSWRFNSNDIERLGAKACEAANRMAGRGPFSIMKTSSNGAPADSEAA